ncbi:MAG: hypothetical protein ACI4VQ_03295 [Clostridia bacterium]
MNKNIIDFTDIKAGWMNMLIYDYRTDEIRKMRISYLQPLFDDLLMACKFLLSDITGIYEVYIDQEGFEAKIRLYKYQDKQISVEIIEDCFEDEIPYNGTSDKWESFHKRELIPTTLTYFNVDIDNFIKNILYLINKHKKEYNEGFVLSPSEELDIELVNQVKKMYGDKYLSERRGNEETSDT